MNRWPAILIGILCAARLAPAGDSGQANATPADIAIGEITEIRATDLDPWNFRPARRFSVRLDHLPGTWCDQDRSFFVDADQLVGLNLEQIRNRPVVLFYPRAREEERWPVVDLSGITAERSGTYALSLETVHYDWYGVIASTGMSPFSGTTQYGRGEFFRDPRPLDSITPYLLVPDRKSDAAITKTLNEMFPAMRPLFDRYFDDPEWEVHRAKAWPPSIMLAECRYYKNRDRMYEVCRAWDHRLADQMVWREPAVERTLVRIGWVAGAALFLLLLPAVLMHRARYLRPLNLLTTLLMWLACAAGVEWWRSRDHYDQVLFTCLKWEVEVSSVDGRLGWLSVKDEPLPYGPLAIWAERELRPAVASHHRLLRSKEAWVKPWLAIEHGLTAPPEWEGYRYGNEYSSRGMPGGHVYSRIYVPWWMITSAFGILPLARLGGISIRGMIRRRRVRYNRCVDCGFDLRASPERCPECGRAVKGAGVEGAGER